MPLTKKQTKILNQLLKELSAWWKNFDKTLYTDIYNSKDFNDFLERTKEYTTNNILLDSGLAENTSNQIIIASNWSKLKNREFVQETIKKTTMDLIIKVGEDLKNELRQMVNKGYDLGLSNKEIAEAILKRDLEALYIIRGEDTFTETEWNNLPKEERLKYTINNNIRKISPQQRSKMIARTETSRAQNIINYVKAQERGAKSFQVICRSDCCPYCAQTYHDKTPTPEKKELLINGLTFNMETVNLLPPLHPNCRCSAIFK